MTNQQAEFTPFYFYYLNIDLMRQQVFVKNKKDFEDKKAEIEALKIAENYFETLEDLVFYQSTLQKIPFNKLNENI